jgi:hypothetical protein
MKGPAHEAVSKLKNSPKPKFIRVKEADSENLGQISVPDIKRWKGKIIAILDGMEWDWIEPLDSHGNIIGPRVDNLDMGSASELEDLDMPPPGAADASSLAALQGMLSLMLKAQDVALSRQSQAYSVVLDNNQKLLATVATRLESMEVHAAKNWEQMNALHNRLNMEVHRANGGDDDGLESMVKDIIGDVARAKLGLPAGGDDE